MIQLLLVAIVLLPLLPFSFGVNAVLRLAPGWLRALLLLVLPVGGAALLATQPVPQGPLAQVLPAVAVLTALLYAWRLLAVRELFIWARLQATSAWPLVWLGWLFGLQGDQVIAVAVALALPAVVLTLLACALQRRTGGAYLGLRGRLGAAYPRLTGAVAVAVIAALAAPPFPGFFALLMVLHAVPVAAAIALLAVWLLWSWAAGLLWQHALYGAPWPLPAGGSDLPRAAGAAWVVLAVVVVGLGLIGSGTWWMH